MCAHLGFEQDNTAFERRHCRRFVFDSCNGDRFAAEAVSDSTSFAEYMVLKLAGCNSECGTSSLRQELSETPILGLVVPTDVDSVDFADLRHKQAVLQA